jgi:hypothetical protein
MKKTEEKVEEENEEVDYILKKTLDDFCRGLVFFLGQFAYNLAKSEKTAADKAEGVQAKTSQDELTEMLMHSDLLSGGINMS